MLTDNLNVSNLKSILAGDGINQFLGVVFIAASLFVSTIYLKDDEEGLSSLGDTLMNQGDSFNESLYIYIIR